MTTTVTVAAAATSPSAAAAARQKLALSYTLTHESLLMRAPTQRHRSRSAQSFADAVCLATCRDVLLAGRFEQLYCDHLVFPLSLSLSLSPRSSLSRQFSNSCWASLLLLCGQNRQRGWWVWWELPQTCAFASQQTKLMQKQIALGRSVSHLTHRCPSVFPFLAP